MRMFPPAGGRLHRPLGLMHEDLAARSLQPRRRARILHSNFTAAGETSHRPAHAADLNIAAGGPQFTVAPNAIHRDLARRPIELRNPHPSRTPAHFRRCVSAHTCRNARGPVTVNSAPEETSRGGVTLR